MSEEMIQGLIDSLSEKLGVASEVLWVTLIKQARVEAISMIVTGIFMILIIAALFHFSFKVRHVNTSDGVPIFFIISLVFACILTMGMVMEIGCGWIGNLATALYNPEYYAIEQLLQVLK